MTTYVATALFLNSQGAIESEVVETDESLDALILAMLDVWYDSANDPEIIVITDEQARPYATIMGLHNDVGEYQRGLAMVTYRTGRVVYYSVRHATGDSDDLTDRAAIKSIDTAREFFVR